MDAFGGKTPSVDLNGILELKLPKLKQSKRKTVKVD